MRGVTIERGWSFVLGVFLGYQVARVHDRLPFVVKSMQEIKDIITHPMVVVVEADEDAEEGDE